MADYFLQFGVAPSCLLMVVKVSIFMISCSHDSPQAAVHIALQGFHPNSLESFYVWLEGVPWGVEAAEITSTRRPHLRGPLVATLGIFMFTNRFWENFSPI